MGFPMEDPEHDDCLVDGERDAPITDPEPVHGLAWLGIKAFYVEPCREATGILGQEPERGPEPPFRLGGEAPQGRSRLDRVEKDLHKSSRSM